MLTSTLVKLFLIIGLAVAKVSRCTDRLAPKLLTNYYQAYNDGPLADIDFRYSDITFYFQGTTTPKGFDATEYKTTFKQFVDAAHKHGKLAFYTIGGWAASDYFSSLAASEASRQKLATQVAAFLNKHNFDGVDFDWEYPNSETSCTQQFDKADSANFLRLLQVVREKIGDKKYISAAVTPTGLLGPKGTPLTDASGFGKLLDFLVLMNYDTNAPSWSEQTGPNGSLFSTCSSVKSSAQDGLQYWTKAVFPACKLLLGAPSYAYAWTTKSSTLKTQTIHGYETKLYQPSSPTSPKGGPGDVNATSTLCNVTTTSFTGQWLLNDMIKQGLLSENGLAAGNKGFKRYWDACSATPFLFSAAKKQMIPYDDEVSLGLKASFTRDKGMAGLAFFSTSGMNARVYKALRKRL